MSYRLCWLLASGIRMEQRNCPKHVEFYSKNKSEKLVHLVGFITRIYQDARSSVKFVPWWSYCLIKLQYLIIMYYNITKCRFFCIYACSTKLFSSPLYTKKKKKYFDIFMLPYTIKRYGDIPTAMDVFVHFPIWKKTINSVQNSFFIVWFSSVPPGRLRWPHLHLSRNHSYITAQNRKYLLLKLFGLWEGIYKEANAFVHSPIATCLYSKMVDSVQRPVNYIVSTTTA
jgi:hypothetical protein